MSKKTKKTYKKSDLTTGVCWRCGEYSDKIVKGDGRCVYCFEEDELDDNNKEQFMIIETTYSDLIYGVCEHCGCETDKIDPTTGWCVDCIEEERFYQESMRMAEKSFKDW